MSHTYINSEPGLWTAGTYESGRFVPESDHDSSDKAAARAHYLNGGNPAHDQLVAALQGAAVLIDLLRKNCADRVIVNDSDLAPIRSALASAGIYS